MLDTAAAGLVLTGEDKEIVDMVHDFVLKEVRPKAAEHDISGELDWDATTRHLKWVLYVQICRQSTAARD